VDGPGRRSFKTAPVAVYTSSFPKNTDRFLPSKRTCTVVHSPVLILKCIYSIQFKYLICNGIELKQRSRIRELKNINGWTKGQNMHLDEPYAKIR